MSVAAFETQKAIKTAIDALALGVSVYDEVPEDAAKPYIHIGDMTDIDWDADDFNGHEMSQTLHYWSEYSGYKELHDLMDAVKKALHNAAITVTGFTAVLALWEYSEVFTESDGRTRHGVQRFRVILKGD